MVFEGQWNSSSRLEVWMQLLWVVGLRLFLAQRSLLVFGWGRVWSEGHRSAQGLSRVSHQHLCWEERQPGEHRAVPSRVNSALLDRARPVPPLPGALPSQAAHKIKYTRGFWKGNTLPCWRKSQYSPSQMEKTTLAVGFTVCGCAALSKWPQFILKTAFPPLFYACLSRSMNTSGRSCSCIARLWWSKAASF